MSGHQGEGEEGEDTQGAPSGANKDTAWQVLSDGRWLETRVITSNTGGPGPVMRATREAGNEAWFPD